MKRKNLLYVISLLIAIYYNSNESRGQSTGTGFAIGAPNTPVVGMPNYLGWVFGTGLALDIKNEDPMGINFFTSTGLGLLTNQKMIILGTGVAATDGFVGIGCAAPLGTTVFGVGVFPRHRLDVDLGDINVSQLNKGYRIGPNGPSPVGNSDYVLWHNGDITNIFVGVNAGNGSMTGVGGNTLVGYRAGTSLTTSNWNVFIGANAGAAQTDQYSADNTFVGYEAGASTNGTVNAQAYHNSFFGDEAGRNNVTGAENTYIGSHSGRNNSAGNKNVTLGSSAGLNNRGNENTFVGAFAGNTASPTYGQYNTFIGTYANFNNSTLINASAIGAIAIVNHDDQMILGGDFTDANNVHHSTFVGIGLSGTLNGGLGPQNSLEINADPARSSVTATGLRFTQVRNSGSNNTFGQTYDQTTISSWGKVLTVDVNGDVGLTDDIGSNAENAAWVNGSGRIEWGTNRLLHDTEIPMVDGHTGDEWSIYFSGQSTMTNFSSQIGGFDPVDVGIGYTMTSPLRAKLDVWNLTAATANAQYTNQFAGRFSQTGSYTEPSGTTDFIGVYANSVVTHTGNMSNNIGGDFFATSSPGFNIGARGTALGASRINAGLWGTVIPTGPFNFGVYGLVNIVAVPPPIGSISYGVIGDLGVAGVPPCPAFPCPPITWPDAAGYFNGDIVSTTAVYTISDASLKENISDISNPMEIINQLNPKSYTFGSQNLSLQLLSGIRYGLLSNDVENVLPGLVKNCVHPARYDSLGNETHPSVNFKAINYTELIPFLIAAIKEQQTQIDALINAAPQQLQQNPNGDNNSGNSIDVVLASKTIVLNQNVPNPFKENTTIEYFIPDDATNVKIIFTDNKGSVLREVEITEKGKGQLNVYASDLSSGIYTYTIVGNGITIDSKRMVKTK